MNPNLYVATIGQSVWFSEDLGETIGRLPTSKGVSIEGGLYPEGRAWSIAYHPSDLGQLLLGTDQGIYRLDRTTPLWHHVPSGMDRVSVWAVAQSPLNPEILIAGTHPARAFRSTDRGLTWKESSLPAPEHCLAIGSPRVTSIAFDPIDPKVVWIGLEIGGIYQSVDGGVTFKRAAASGLISEDIHDIAIVYPNKKRRLLVTTDRGLHLSDDDGATFTWQKLLSPWQYTRAVVPHPTRPGVVFLTNGNGPPGSTGTVFRSEDFGSSWRSVSLSAAPNSTPWSIATNAADPNLMFFATNLGQIFRSTDGGEHWQKLSRELGEVRAIAWMPSLK